jgi:hypothetical protein
MKQRNLKKLLLGGLLAILMASAVGCVYDYDHDHYWRDRYYSRRYDPYYYRRYDPYYARRYDYYYYRRAYPDYDRRYGYNGHRWEQDMD